MIINVIRQALADLPAGVTGCCVAFSGGQDSAVLLHALAAVAPESSLSLRAVHVNHGLHPDAARWATQCQSECDALGVLLTSLVEATPHNAGRGIEAAARDTRYAAMAEQLRSGECLLTAHHEDDQLETVLLRLLRGTGVQGLRGILPLTAFADGWLLRPLLGVPKAQIVGYAQSHRLDYLVDPSNENASLDRNYLRLHVIPLLRSRWPGVAATASRTARLAHDAVELLDDVASSDRARLTEGGGLELAGFRQLAPHRQRALLRYAIRQQGSELPSEVQLAEGLAQLLGAAADRRPVMNWPGGQIRRYRERLYLLDADPDRAYDEYPDSRDWSSPTRPLELGVLRGAIRFELVPEGGLTLPDAPLQVRFRAGGERIQGIGHQHSAALKKLFQHWGILPWMRAHVPLVYARGRLVAVADLMSAAEFAATAGEPGYKIVWEGHAPCRAKPRSN